MEFWLLWYIGIFIVIGTRIAINKLSRNVDIYNKNKAVKITINVLIIICISIVGGILIGEWIGMFAANSNWHSLTMDEQVCFVIFIDTITIIVALITYGLCYLILGLYYFYKESQKLFAVAFIVSIIGWAILICQYNCNIETTTQTVVVSQAERELLYFCNITVQNVSGEISGSSTLGYGSVFGEITTSDNLSYWCLNENGEGIFDSISATTSKIVFIDDNQSPYVEIVSYATQTVYKNHNNGTEKTVTDGTWTEYDFYLPKEIMQYNFN